jgi:hypothetical protein
LQPTQRRIPGNGLLAVSQNGGGGGEPPELLELLELPELLELLVDTVTVAIAVWVVDAWLVATTW